MTGDDAAGAASRPIIGLTTSHLATEEAGVRQRWDAARIAYAEAVAAAGGLPVLLPPPAADQGQTAEAIARRVFDVVDGLVLTGGGDVDPARYGQAPHPATKPADDARDEFEIALTRIAIARDVPLLGICRGAQVLCVAMGGDLVQDVASEVAGALAHTRAEVREMAGHDLRVARGSALGAIYGTDTLAVNSTHHQAPGALAGGLVAVAHSPDGVIEAVELPSARWVIGVQWHPEDLWKSYPEQRLLFNALVRAAADAAQRGREGIEHGA